jgi:predicted RNA-binding protein YlqC (UPF0109 family)
MKDLVEYIARQLVDDPDTVEVMETQGEAGSLIELRVAKKDIGRLIGRHGSIANSIRTILYAIASRHGRTVTLEIIEEVTRGQLRLVPFLSTVA